MLDAWPVVLFWPAVVLGLILAARGVASGSVLVTATGAALTLPASFYLTASPALGLVGLLPVTALAAAAWSVKRRRSAIAYVVVTVSAGFFALVAAALYVRW